MAKFDSNKHHRRSIRLKGYDYSNAGAYFVTVCVKDRQCLLGDVIEGKMILNKYGRIVEACWFDLENHYDNIVLDAFVVMPNHFHGIIIISQTFVGAGLRPALTIRTDRTKRHGLPEIVRAIKSFSARRINEQRGTTGTSFWQRNYYEHIIRNGRVHDVIREYIHHNPLKWEQDKLYPVKNQSPTA